MMTGRSGPSRSYKSAGSSSNRLVLQTVRRYFAMNAPALLRNHCASLIIFSVISDLARRCRGSVVRVEQAVQMHDEIAHMRIIDGLLRLCFPGRVGRRIIRKNADDVELAEIAEFKLVDALELAPEHEMQ